MVVFGWLFLFRALEDVEGAALGRAGQIVREGVEAAAVEYGMLFPLAGLRQFYLLLPDNAGAAAVQGCQLINVGAGLAVVLEKLGCKIDVFGIKGGVSGGRRYLLIALPKNAPADRGNAALRFRGLYASSTDA